MAKSKRDDRLDFDRAARLLEELWLSVSVTAEANPNLQYLEDPLLRSAISAGINHPQVSYRFCLPVQLLGKLTNPALDCLSLQRGKSDQETTSWDARTLASKIIAPFNLRQESVLGSSGDPYVGNAMLIPRMIRDDVSKRDIPNWNMLIGVLETVQKRSDVNFTEAVFRQCLLEIHQRQQGLRFSYPIPPRVSLSTTLALSQQFLAEKSGGDRALALAGALFDVIGVHFHLFAQVNRARINASDESSGQAADLECVNEQGEIVMAVEVKDRALKLADVEGTITKTRHRAIHDVLFTVPRVDPSDAEKVNTRIATAFAGGQNLYVADFFDLGRVVLALGGEPIRVLFLRKVGEHLDFWNTQPSHRQAWKRLLQSV